MYGRNLQKIIAAALLNMGIVDILGINKQNVRGEKFISGFVDVCGHMSVYDIKRFQMIVPMRRKELAGGVYHGKVNLG